MKEDAGDTERRSPDGIFERIKRTVFGDESFGAEVCRKAKVEVISLNIINLRLIMINNKVNVRDLGRRASKANVQHIKVDIRLPLIKYIKKCVHDLRVEKHIIVDNVIIGRLRNNTSVLTDEAGCFYACLNKKLGFVRKDGSYDIDILENLPQKQNNWPEYNRTVKMARKCQRLSNNDECKMALCFYQEMLIIKYNNKSLIQ